MKAGTPSTSDFIFTFLTEQDIKVAVAKEVGVGNPVEETTTRIKSFAGTLAKLPLLGKERNGNPKPYSSRSLKNCTGGTEAG